MTCVISHQDGTSETNPIIAPDWFGAFNSTTGAYTQSQDGTTLVPVEAFSALGRCTVNGYGNTGNVSQCILWSLDIPLTNTTSAVTNVAFTWHDGGRCCIFALSGSTGGAFAPIAVSGYNGDPVVEATPLPLPYNATMDNGTNINSGGAGANTWFEIGWDTAHPAAGFPYHGSIMTSISTGRPYQMAPSYQGPMSALVDTNHQIVNLVPQVPQAYTALSLLTAGASIGAANVMSNIIILQHADGINETNIFFGFDWFNDNAVSAGVPVVVAYEANGRCSFNAARSLNSDPNTPNLNPRLFESQFQLKDTTSPITNIQCRYFLAGGANWTTYVLAVAGTTDPIPVVLFPAQLPAAQNVVLGSNASFGTQLLFGSGPTYQWQVGPSFTGPFVNLTDGLTGTGSKIFGSTTSNLVVSNVGLSDVAYYTCLVTNAGTTNVQLRTPAPLTINNSAALSVMSQPTDPISDFGDALASPAGQGVGNVIDGTLAIYQNFGPNATNSPFVGPCGFTTQPEVGGSVVSALKFYPGNVTPEDDPADYLLEGSNDGTTWTAISSGSLAISDAQCRRRFH